MYTHHDAPYQNQPLFSLFIRQLYKYSSVYVVTLTELAAKVLDWGWIFLRYLIFHCQMTRWLITGVRTIFLYKSSITQRLKKKTWTAF